MTDQAKGLLLTTLGVAFISPDSLFIRLIDAPALTTTFWRALPAGVMIFLFLTVASRGNPWPAFRALGRPGIAYAVIFSFASLLFVTAVSLTAVANAVFILSTAPVYAAVISRIFLREPIRFRTVVTVVLCMVGVGIIVSGSVHSGVGNPLGDLCAVGTALCLAISFTIARHARKTSMVPAVVLSYALTTLALLPFARPTTLDGTDWLFIAALGGVCVPIATSLISTGPRYITPAEVSTLLLLEAVLAPLLVWMFLGENPGPRALGGGALVLAVLLVANLLAIREARRRLALHRTMPAPAPPPGEGA